MINCTIKVILLSILLMTTAQGADLRDPDLTYAPYKPQADDIVISRSDYINKLHGFWLAQSLANWTGLITELDKEGPDFYTDDNWGGLDQPAFYGLFMRHASRIDYFYVTEGKVWGADDDTDIEYIYQHLLDRHNTSILTGEQIRDGWLKHIYSNEDAPISNSGFVRENWLWVSNEKAYYLMKDKGLVPPQTSEPENNDDYDMIDAQLTTEIFGFFAPARPDIALKMAHLPIRVAAKNESEWIAEFNVIMYSLASSAPKELSAKDKIMWMADKARSRLPEGSYPASMYDSIKASYLANDDKGNWEKTRDELYRDYQLGGKAGYKYKRIFDAGINFGASLVSLFYGEGDLLKTIKIGTLAGWDSDNPTATWGGLLGFMLGKEGVEKAFNEDKFSQAYWISRTRRNFPDYTPDQIGEDTFPMMSRRGIYIIDRVVMEQMGGGIDLDKDVWYIPNRNGALK